MTDYLNGELTLRIFLRLYTHGKASIDELAKRFGVHRRSIERRIDDLSTFLPIIITRGVYGGVELDKDFSLRRYKPLDVKAYYG